MGKHYIQIPSCSHAGFVAFDADGTHGMVAYIFWGGYNVTTSPLRLLDSLLGDTGRSWHGGDRGLFLATDPFERSLCTCSTIG